MQIANGSRGVIRDVLYPSTDDPLDFAVVWAELQGYRGPSVIRGAPSEEDCKKWAPIRLIKRLCDGQLCACFREEIPLECNKASTAHSLQGETVGDGKSVEKLLFFY